MFPPHLNLGRPKTSALEKFSADHLRCFHMGSYYNYATQSFSQFKNILSVAQRLKMARSGENLLEMDIFTEM